MKIYRRQRQQYVFATLLGIIGVITLLFFFILYEPARSEYYRLQDSIRHLRADIETRRQKIETLERLYAQLWPSFLFVAFLILARPEEALFSSKTRH